MPGYKLLVDVAMRWLIALVMLIGVMTALPCDAHHGGLGIEGDLVEWALKVDQWQAEVLAQGYRIKFLSYPRQPLRTGRTRLVFEIQSALTGQYVSGLKAELIMRSPDGTSRILPLPETNGVTAYYETTVPFAQTGVYRITFQSEATGGKLQGTFRKTVRASVLSGDWTVWLGYLAVTLAGVVTWLGLLLSIQRRFRVDTG